MTLIEQTITINGGRVSFVNRPAVAEHPRSLRRDVEDLKAEMRLDSLKPLVDELCGEDDRREHGLQRAEPVLGGGVGVLSDRGLVDLDIEPLPEFQDVSPSVASESVAAVARVEPTVGEQVRDGGLVTRPVASSAPAASTPFAAGAPTPYFSDGTVTVYHGDCLDLLDVWRDAAVLITDPPYGLQGIAGAYGTTHRTIANDQDTTVRDAVLEVWGDRPAAVFGSPRLEEPPGGWSDRLVWDKGQLGLNGGAWRYAHESIFVRGNGWVRLNDSSSSILRYSSQGNRRNVAKHIHSKPVPLIAQLVASAPPGLIVDPFGGGGSTAVACATLGRPVVIIELEREHCDTIVSRLQQQTFDFGVIS